MTRRSLFKAILGGIGAVFLPKTEKKESKESPKWMQVKVKQNGSTCSCDCDWPTITMVGYQDSSGFYINSYYVDGVLKSTAKRKD